MLLVAGVRSQNTTDCASLALTVPDCAALCLINVESTLHCNKICVCIQQPGTIFVVEECAAQQCTGEEIQNLINSIEACTQLALNAAET